MIIEQINLSALSREEWLAHRQQDVTASVMGTLLGVDAFQTPYGLWALKTGAITEDPEESGPMLRGRLLEPVHRKLIGEKNPTWKIRDPQLYLRDPRIRLGATPDCYVDIPDRGFGIIQLKSVESSIFRSKWRDSETGEIQPPMWIVIQALTEAHLSDAQFAMVSAMVIGFGIDTYEIEIPIHQGVIQAIRQAAVDFWQMVESGKVPPFDWRKDADLIANLYPHDNGRSIDLTHNNRIRGLGAEYAERSVEEKAAKDRKKEIKAEIVSIMGDHAIGLLDGQVFCTLKTVNKKESIVKATSYRDLRFKKGFDE